MLLRMRDRKHENLLWCHCHRNRSKGGEKEELEPPFTLTELNPSAATAFDKSRETRTAAVIKERSSENESYVIRILRPPLLVTPEGGGQRRLTFFHRLFRRDSSGETSRGNDSGRAEIDCSSGNSPIDDDDSTEAKNQRTRSIDRDKTIGAQPLKSGSDGESGTDSNEAGPLFNRELPQHSEKRMQNKNDRNQRREENVSQENTNFDDRPPTSHNSDVEQSTNGDGSSDRRSCDHFVGDCCSTLPWNTSDRSPPTTPKNEPPTAVCGGQATSSTAFPEEKSSGSRPSVVDDDPILQMVFRPFQKAATSNVESSRDEILNKVFTIFPLPEKCTEDDELSDESFRPAKSYPTKEFDRLTKAQRRMVLASHIRWLDEAAHSSTAKNVNRLSSISERSEEERSVGRLSLESEKTHEGDGVERTIIRSGENVSIKDVNRMPNNDVTSEVEDVNAATVAEKAAITTDCDVDSHSPLIVPLQPQVFHSPHPFQSTTPTAEAGPSWNEESCSHHVGKVVDVTGANGNGSRFKRNSESENDSESRVNSVKPVQPVDDERKRVFKGSESPPMKSYEDDPLLREVFLVLDRNVSTPLNIEIPLHQAPLRHNAVAHKAPTNESSVRRDSVVNTEKFTTAADNIFVHSTVENGGGPMTVSRMCPLSTPEALWSPSDSGFARENGSDSSSLMNVDVEDYDHCSPHIEQLNSSYGSEHRSHFQVAPTWPLPPDSIMVGMESSEGGLIRRSAPLAIPLQHPPGVVTYLTDSGVYLESDVGSLTVEFSLKIDQKPTEDSQRGDIENEESAVVAEACEFESDSLPRSSDLNFSRSSNNESHVEKAGAVGWRPIEAVELDGPPSPLFRSAVPPDADDDDFDEISLIKPEFKRSDSLEDPQMRLLSMLSEGSTFCPFAPGNSAEEAASSGKHSIASTDPSMQSWTPLENVPARSQSTSESLASDGSADIVDLSKLSKHKDSATKSKKFSEDIHRLEAEKQPHRPRVDLLEVIKSYNSAVSTASSPSRPPRQLITKRLWSLPEERYVEDETEQKEEEHNDDNRRAREESIELQFKSATLGQLCGETRHVILTDDIEQCQLSTKAVAKTRRQKRLAKSASATEVGEKAGMGDVKTTSFCNLSGDGRPVVELAQVGENLAPEPNDMDSCLNASDSNESKSITPTLFNVTIRSLPTGGGPKAPSLPRICEERWPSTLAEPVKSDYGMLLQERHFRESTTVVDDSRQEAIAYTSTTTRYSTNHGSYRSIVNVGQLAADDEWSFADAGIPLVFDRPPPESDPFELSESLAIPYNYCNIALEKDDSSRILSGIIGNGEFDEKMSKFSRGGLEKETDQRLISGREESEFKKVPSQNVNEVPPQIHHDILMKRNGGELPLNPSSSQPTTINGKDEGTRREAHRLVMEHTNITEIVYSSKSCPSKSSQAEGKPAGKEELFTRTSIQINSFALDELFTDLSSHHRNAMSQLEVKRMDGKPSYDNAPSKYYVISKKKEDDDGEVNRQTAHFDEGTISTVNGLERRDFGVQTEADPMLDACCRLRLLKPRKRDVTKQMLAENGVDGSEKRRNGAISCHEHEFLVCRNPRHNLRHDHCDPIRLYAIRRATTAKPRNNVGGQSIERPQQPLTSFPNSYSRTSQNQNPSVITVDSRNTTNAISVHHTPGSDWIVSSVCKALSP